MRKILFLSFFLVSCGGEIYYLDSYNYSQSGESTYEAKELESEEMEDAFIEAYEIIAEEIISVYSKALKKDNSLGSVSAHSYLDDFKSKSKFDFYISKRHSSWCWGTWSRVWNDINWNETNYKNHFSKKKEVNKFSEGGKDLNLLLWGNYKKFIDSWAIRFNFFCAKKELKSFQPRLSMIRNDGRDFTGTHEKFSFSKNKRYDCGKKARLDR